ncbi:MAG: hypothetical protein ACI4WS_12050 [Oscillospiraceae bacterium]
MSIRSKAVAVLCAGMLAVTGAVGVTAQANDPTMVVFAVAGTKSSLSSLKSSLAYPMPNMYAEWWSDEMYAEEAIPVLAKSRTLKKNFQLKQDEKLIIPNGKTLTLTGGADIRGTIYIENGGRLLLKHGTLSLFGNILCEGRIHVTGGTLLCHEDSMLYIFEEGKFTAADRGITELDDGYEINGRIDILAGANAVCFGTTNIPVPYLDSEPVAAVYKKQSFGGAQLQTEVITDSARLNELMDVPFNTSFELCEGSFADYYTVLFSGGGAVTYRALGNIGGGFDMVGNVDVQMIHAVLDSWHRPVALKTVENAFATSAYVVQAKYLSHTANEDYVEYSFEVEKRYRGRYGAESTITLRRDREWSDEYTQEFSEGECILPLKLVEPMNGENYYVLSSNLYIPVNDGKADCISILGENTMLDAPVTTDYLAALAFSAAKHPELDIVSE